MNASNYLVNLSLSGVMIVGIYQFYFWCQRNALREPRELLSRLDDLIPYVPRWVWIYSFLYYPAIFYVNRVVETPQQFTQVASSYMLLSILQVGFFLGFPVRTPDRWRVAHERAGLSERFLAFVQRVDAPSNSFPSMHTSVAMLTALHLYDIHGPATLAFPALIGMSCLFTKQHYVVDIPAGAALGWFTYAIYLQHIVA